MKRAFEAIIAALLMCIVIQLAIEHYKPVPPYPANRLMVGKWYYVAERPNGHYEYQDCTIRKLKDILGPRLLFEDQHGNPNKFDMVMARDVVGEAPEPEPKAKHE